MPDTLAVRLHGLLVSLLRDYSEVVGLCCSTINSCISNAFQDVFRQSWCPATLKSSLTHGNINLKHLRRLRLSRGAQHTRNIRSETTLSIDVISAAIWRVYDCCQVLPQHFRSAYSFHQHLWNEWNVWILSGASPNNLTCNDWWQWHHWWQIQQ